MRANVLSRDARATITAHGVKPAAYIREHFPHGTWKGDLCGCPDDRCAGHHHDPSDPCGCLRTLLADMPGY